MEQYIIENLKRVFGNNITIGVDIDLTTPEKLYDYLIKNT